MKTFHPKTVALIFAGLLSLQTTHAQPALETKPLTVEGDIASHLVAGVDRFLLRELSASIARREQHWSRDFTSHAAYARSVEPNRKRLANIIGLRDERVAFDGLTLASTTAESSLVGQTDRITIRAVSWPAFGDVTAAGLLLEPRGRDAVANVVALPDCNQLPEQIAGLAEGLPPELQYARRLAGSGCRVVVPLLVNRAEKMSKLSNREFLYRSAFEMGRHLIGYEVQQSLAVVDWFSKRWEDTPIGIIGWGEGGLIALYAAAVDTRIDAACVSGYFDSRQNIWQEPIDRNVFGLLDQFGDAELATLIAPRTLIVDVAQGPEATIPGGRGAPARVVTPALDSVRAEVARAQTLTDGLKPAAGIQMVAVDQPLGGQALGQFMDSLKPGTVLGQAGAANILDRRNGFSAAKRHAEQVHKLDRHTQWVLRESPYIRKQFYKPNTSSLAKFEASNEKYRRQFYEDAIGRFANEVLPFNARSRKSYESEKWVGHEVVLDVFQDVIAYGILILPRDLKANEQRPVVVCQHGLEGRPQDIIEGDHRAYHDFAAKLAERGFITFSPQNLYIFRDRFRTLQRKANPLKKSLFSVIIPQHQQIVDWLKTLPYVDKKRIAFYGLSYGGKTAMRVPPVVTDYCLSICSADFNEWVDKNASTRDPHSYVNTGEYEIFEWDLGSTFNYAEMAGLIAPRPFMVERGHHDGVASDETVGWEFAKVRYLYQGKLKLQGRCEIEWFDGPHTINGRGTYDFLHRYLDWPRR
ncbi:MAG: dienelactone hydrolase family protein [Pedosphaera sp.]|nr:dienelactone hydrolase family protein [Pedosphaera sp.]